MARVHVSDDVWAEFRRAAGNTPMSQVLGRLVEREVERARARRIRHGTVDDQLVLDALERARELHEDVAAIIERLELLRPIYRKTTNYGHFGKAGLSWEG